MSSIGKRIKEIRRLANQKQSDFSQKIGIDRTHVSNLENDRANLSISLRKLICAEYGINEEWLVTGTGNMYSDKKLLNSSLKEENDDEYLIKIDFSKHIEILNLIKKKAKEDFRPLSHQILFMLRNALESENTDQSYQELSSEEWIEIHKQA